MIKMTMRFRPIHLLFLIPLFAFFAYQESKYVVTESEQVVVTQFGKVVKSRKEPGTYYKIPTVQQTHYYSKDIQKVESSNRIPTLGKKYLGLKMRVFWKISDPVLFFKNVYDFRNGRQRIIDISEPAGRMAIISHNLDEILEEINIKKTENLKTKRAIELEILEYFKPRILKTGIEVINIEAKVNYPI